MMKTRRIFVLLVVIAASLLVVSIFLVPAFVDLDHYRPQIISYFEQSTGKKVEIERLAISFFPNTTIHIQNFGVKSPPLFPSSYILKVPQADVVIEFWPLLRRRIVIRSLVLQGPVINLISDPDGPWNFENPETQNSKNLFPIGNIDKMVINRGQLILSNLLPSDAQGPVFMEAHEIYSELDQVDLAAIVNPASRSLNGQGHWKAARLRFGAVETTNVNANVRLESKEVNFTDLKVDAYSGKATGDFSVSFAKPTASFRADARMTGINMTKLLASFHEERGRITGTLVGDLRLLGNIEHTNNPLAHMTGVGHVKITNGQVPSLALNANLMKLAHYNNLGPAKENPASFSSISTDLELENLRITSKAIDVDGYGVDVDGSGSVSVSGSDDLDYQGVATITTKQGFFTNTLGRFAGGKLVDGKLTFPFRIGGKIEDPKFFMASRE